MAGEIQKNKFEIIGLMSGTDAVPTITIAALSALPCEILSCEVKDNVSTKENSGTSGAVTNVTSRLMSTECSLSIALSGETLAAALTGLKNSKPAPLDKVVIAGAHVVANTENTPNGNWLYKDGWSVAFAPSERAIVKLNLVQYPGITVA